MEQLQTKAKELQEQINSLLNELMFTFDTNKYMEIDQKIREAVMELSRIQGE